MTTYFEAPDGHGESTVWARNPDRPDHPVAIIRSHDVHTHYWPDVVARMTGTTITTDDATVDVIARAIYESKNPADQGFKVLPWDHPRMSTYQNDWVREQYRPAARAILAALTGVPHD